MKTWQVSCRNNAARRAFRRPGFTLIELLVVVSIISLLIALLAPNLARSREAARRTKCLSNQRQISLAINGYVQENKDYFVPYKTPFDPVPAAYWGGLLAKGGFIAPGEPFSCPSYEPARRLHLNATAFDPGGNWFFTQYGLNWRNIGSRHRQYGATTLGVGTPPAPCPTPRVSEVKKPPETILTVDSYGKVWEGTTNESGITFVGDSDTSSGTGRAHARHMDAVNVAFVDGHAETFLCSVPTNPYTPDAITDADLSPNDNLWDLK